MVIGAEVGGKDNTIRRYADCTDRGVSQSWESAPYGRIVIGGYETLHDGRGWEPETCAWSDWVGTSSDAEWCVSIYYAIASH